jgi:hypothetical protein
MRRLLTALIISGCLSLCPAGVILYNSLDDASEGTMSISDMGPLYDSFHTGASAFSFFDVWVELQLPDLPYGSVTVALYADSGSNTPGGQLAIIGTLDGHEISDTLTVYELVASTPLAATRRYWIGLSTDDDSGAVWSWANSSGVGVAGEYYSDRAGTFGNESGPFQMRLEGENGPGNIPEPASLLMLGGALLALGLLRRRRTP